MFEVFESHNQNFEAEPTGSFGNNPCFDTDGVAYIEQGLATEDINDCFAVLGSLERVKTFITSVQARIIARADALAGCSPDFHPAALERGTAHRIALVTHQSPRGARAHLQRLRHLIPDMPYLFDQFEKGLLPEDYVHAVLRTLDGLSAPEHATFDAYYEDHPDLFAEASTNEIKEKVQAYVDLIHPEERTEELHTAATDRHVDITKGKDFYRISGTLPPEVGVGLQEFLYGTARKLRENGDERTTAQLRADITANALTNNPVDERVPAKLHVNVIVTDRTIFLGQDGTVHVEGYGSLPAEYLRDLIAEATTQTPAPAPPEPTQPQDAESYGNPWPDWVRRNPADEATTDAETQTAADTDDVDVQTAAPHPDADDDMNADPDAQTESFSDAASGAQATGSETGTADDSSPWPDWVLQGASTLKGSERLAEELMEDKAATRARWAGTNVDNSTAARLAAFPAFRRLFADPTGQNLVAMDSKERLFTGQLRHLIKLRDRECRTPYCTNKATEADHVHQASQGGPTSYLNGCMKCRSCNLAKESPGWEEIVVDTAPHQYLIRPTSQLNFTSTAPPLTGLARLQSILDGPDPALPPVPVLKARVIRPVFEYEPSDDPDDDYDDDAAEDLRRRILSGEFDEFLKRWNDEDHFHSDAA